ncbi:16S rRNA (guanine(966)-N(2))-methyltransferase RsmD [Autumnicola musiva]|uniref:16S rRNA (Guanine(966)-N(2))-methyltransferase RsmD n=1 Tax=Autumnicola musiva TaxID=3075589 RepID=A0ABU3DA50_9FLAO|nr:16S rRNA (guanine(966)-N(2))-methyltransferase RsmD [Zunongwangia sp. F117]MDT0678230.1 16S rRNA (guanine(966)-N(2))-methyltransferase RsmD [Zunongwangia sp. F117]
MRIISGTNKGRRITAPKKLPVRPTTDMAKEALFNILANQFHPGSISILDLFAGTGNISYEFASRGAEMVTAVDENFECVKFIKKTTAELDFNISVIKSDVYKYLEKSSAKFDVVFADPPYNFDQESFAKIADLTFANKILKPEGLLIIEHWKRTDLSTVENFEEVRNYGNSAFSFFR